MNREFTEGQYILGIEGLALLRAGAQRDGADAVRRTHEIAVLAARLGEDELQGPRILPVADPDVGYAAWAGSYDNPGNDMMAVEEPAVLELLRDLPRGPVLDAACGTGRYAAHLTAAGREEVTGVDSSPAMLAIARAKLPQVQLREGSLEALPLDDDSVTGAVCALALSHLPELDRAVAELARVLAPGGRLIISNPHPFATAILGWRATYTDDAGARHTIPEYPHMAADYVRAFTAAGLTIHRCLEPTLSADQAQARAKSGYQEAFAQALAGMPAAIVWDTTAQVAAVV